MKHKLLIPFLLICFGSVFSQVSNDRIIYFDSLHNVASETNYKYKRVIKDYYITKDSYEETEYYKSGAIKMKRSYLNGYEFRPTGMTIHYYQNGNRESLTNSPTINPNYSKVFKWYENGEKKSEIEIIFDENDETPMIRILQFWDTNGNQKIVDGNGEHEEDNHEEWSKGSYANGYKNGVWIGKDKIYNFTYSENYSNGKLISGKSIDSNKTEHDYTVLLKKAMPKKGIIDYKKYIGEVTRKYILSHNGNCTIERYLTFTINPDGNISDFKIVKGPSDTVNDKIDEKLIKALKKYGTWNPRVARGNIVKQEFKEGIVIKSTVNYN